MLRALTCVLAPPTQLGDVIVQLSLTVAIFNQVLLFMPVSKLDSPLLTVRAARVHAAAPHARAHSLARNCAPHHACSRQAWLQEFAWTLADLPLNLARRNAHLASHSMRVNSATAAVQHRANLGDAVERVAHAIPGASGAGVGARTELRSAAGRGCMVAGGATCTSHDACPAPHCSLQPPAPVLP